MKGWRQRRGKGSCNFGKKREERDRWGEKEMEKVDGRGKWKETGVQGRWKYRIEGSG